jgi:hypothetical protein
MGTQADRLAQPNRCQPRNYDEGDSHHRDRQQKGEPAAPIRRTGSDPSAVPLRTVESIELAESTLDLTSLPTLLT